MSPRPPASSRPPRFLARGGRLPVLRALALLSAGLVLAGCGADSRSSAAAPPSPSASTSPAAPALPPPPPPPPSPPTDPLTGAVALPPGPVVALKIDNSPLARPYHRGLDHASLLYQEVMEGGATRFFGVFAPATDAEVGPIRSGREGDVELVRQFGKIALGSSGANTGVLDTMARAADQGLLLDANYEAAKPAYRRAEKRRDAYNFFTSPALIDQIRPGGAPAKDIGLRFGAVAPGPVPATRARVRMSDIALVTVTFDPATGRYTVLQDGVPMNDYAPANVVVQQTTVRETAYVDVIGNATPYTETVGKGAVTVLRDGVEVDGTWDRPAPELGTRLADAAGADLPLAVGPSLFLLVPAGTAVDVG